MRAAVVGGGVAGGALACLLGPGTVLFEREAAAHDKVCGEFLSHEALLYLGRLGVSPAALGAAPIGAVRLVHGGRTAEARLPFPAAGLSRRVLDAALLARAEARGAEVRRGCTVRGLSEAGLELEGAAPVQAPAVFLATGKHDLRGARRVLLAEPEALVGLKMYLDLRPEQAAALAGHVEVVLFRGGYAGLLAVEGGTANLCLLIARERFEEAGRGWPGVQALLERECPHLRTRLHHAAPRLARPLTIFRVPYGFLHRPGAADPDGLFRLGDQAGVIPSFSGDGVSIALHSAFVAAQHAAQQRAAGPYHRRIRRDLSGQIGRAGMLYRAARAHPALLLAAARLWPGILPWAARLTRVPGRALLPHRL